MDNNITWTKTLNKNRASGIIIKNNEILLIHRIRDDKEYWVIPGGSIEQGESIEQALDREILEELGVRVEQKELLFEMENSGRSEYHFLIKQYSGEPKMGGPELTRMNEQNQFILETRDLTKLSEINLLPFGVADKLHKFLRK